MRNRYLKIFNAILLICYFIIIPNNLLGYDNKEKGVHERISREAWTITLGQRDFLQDLGLTEAGLLIGKKPENWIAEGSRVEDNLPRPRHHFYDPVSKEGLHDTCGLPVIGGAPSPNWALGIEGGNDWDIKHARKYEYIALTGNDSGGSIVQDAQDDNGRKKYFGRMFKALGQVIHILADSAQPEHVRNDAHVFPWDVSLYEDYTQRNATMLSYTGYSLVTLPSFYSYFDTGDGKGLSEFTNRNFVSRSTNFDDTGLCRQKAGIYAEPTPDYAHDEDETVPLPEGGTKTFAVYYIGNTVKDKLTGEEIRNDYLSALSWWNFETEREYSEKVYSLNDKCYDSTANFTIPRAVGYSAGLLNYFFRGSIGIDLDQNSPDEVVVENLSSERMTGTFSLYYEDSNNNRNLVKDWGLDIMPYSPEYASLSTCDLTSLSPKPEKFILVFQGKMGNETGAVVGNADITSLKTTCGTGLSISGSDTISKNSSESYTVAGCTGCSDDVTWSAVGADIDKDGHLSASDTACGTVTLTAECSKCNLSSSRNIKVNCDPLTITGPDLVEKNKIYNYKAEGCCEEVEWYALGIGATITPDGMLITDDTLTGLITVVAICQKCDTFATKDVKTLCDPEIAITGSDTIAKSEMQQYTASGCNKPVAWSVDGKATITETGMLVTDETSCGPLTVKAQCPECEPPATKNVQITCDPLTITGSDTTTKNSTKQYTATGCCGEVQWSVSGKGATISSSGLLTTGSTACGSLTITATCPECGTSDTQDVRVTDAGYWHHFPGPRCTVCWIDDQDCYKEWTEIVGNLKYNRYIQWSPNAWPCPTCDLSAPFRDAPTECWGGYTWDEQNWHISAWSVDIFEWRCLP